MATIQHSAIEGYMDAMTMAFPVHADEVWSVLTPGAEVRADLVVDSAAKDPFYLENLVVTPPADTNNPLPVNDKFAQVGQDVPDFSLTNQDGKRISIKDFRGHPLAITFIYARCPLPDYCIRMSTNFSDIANKVMADPAQRDKIRLLSISFDPANDTPEKLRSYGLGYLGKNAKPDFTVWQLAVGKDAEVKKIADFFGLQYETDASDKTKINHSLVTAVIATDGKVRKIFKGNDWTPAELLTELTDAEGR
ncbi:MAG: SCO family protein [Acidobacteria bacterium]|nr:SCO family protein [Acidobacteriota bacterium]